MKPEIQDQERDEQDQSEVFDEDVLSDDETGQRRAERRTFDEMVDVADYTSAVGDSDDEAGLIGEDLEPEAVIELEADAPLADFEDDEIAGELPEELHSDRSAPARVAEVPAGPEGRLDDIDRRPQSAGLSEPPLLAAGSADTDPKIPVTDLEADRLSDAQIAALGYGPADKDPGDGVPGAAVLLRICLRSGLWALDRDGDELGRYGQAARATHEALSIAGELRAAGQPARVELEARPGQVLEITSDDPRTWPAQEPD